MRRGMISELTDLDIPVINKNHNAMSAIETDMYRMSLKKPQRAASRK